MPNKLYQFWQELKRRNVTRVLAVYIAAGFMILELVDMVSDPFGLPEWSVKVAFFFLLAGLVLALILSWIYDIHPEGGMVKTEPAERATEGIEISTSKSWKTASYISFVVILVLIILNILPRLNRKEVLDKSIAVLPFINDSPDQERMYFINGTMEAILDRLCKIEDLRVPGRTSVEQYRENPKPIPMIAEEMNVSYILEGSGHRDGNKVRLIIQLLDGRKDQHIWSKTYDADIEEIFSMQNDIAKMVADEIEAIITPEEQELIARIPTTDLTAYDFYQRGKEEYWKNQLDNNTPALLRAEEFYGRALKHDSTFALAYTGLAWVYWDMQSQGYSSYQESYFSEVFLDSVLILADKALSYDPQLSDAYTIRGLYYHETGRPEQAGEEFDKAIDLNPNDWMAYWRKGKLNFITNPLIAIQNYHKAILLNRGSELPLILDDISTAYFGTGFNEKSKYYNQEKLKLNNDSVSYLYKLNLITKFEGNYTEALEYIKRAYQLDTTNIYMSNRLAWTLLDLQQYEMALVYYEKFLDRMKSTGAIDLDDMHRIGYAYWKNGYKKEADYYFGKQIEYCEKSMELGRTYTQTFAHYDLAGVYAFIGEREKAYSYLRIFNQEQIMNQWYANLLKTDPLFDSIRDEPEFQQILSDVEAKFLAEHERVRKWLEENDLQ